MFGGFDSRRVHHRAGTGLVTTVVLIALALTTSCHGAATRTVIVYTSLDQPFSQPILDDFSRETGIDVRAVYDVEAVKTTGLVTRLIAEKNRPVADVFWSSEFAQTIHLQREGVLEPYASPEGADIPARFKDADHHWTGFACRARVLIVNTDRVPEADWPRSLQDLVDARWGPGEVGIANPLFGTTGTHAAALYAVLGAERAREFFRELDRTGARVLDGNSMVRDLVAAGELKIGLTDTDDAYVGLDRGAPLAVIFPDQQEGQPGTLVIPNTVALIRGARHRDEATRLIDYLLSREVESRLAFAVARQMPTRPGIDTPPEVPELRDLRTMDVDYDRIADRLEPTLTELREILLK